MEISAESITPLFKTYMFEIFFGIWALLLAYIAAKTVKETRNKFPPGPMGFPLFGYLPFLTKDVHLDLMDLGKKYGDVFSIKFGPRDVVILHGADAIIEAFNKPEFLGRPPGSTMQKVLFSSAFFSYDFILWKEQRKPVVQFMKDLGLGKTKIEENIMDEINYFMDVLRNSETQPIDVRKYLCSSISNNIFSLVSGKRFEYDDPERQFLDKTIKEYFKHNNHIYLDVLFPCLSYIPFAGKFLRSHKSRSAIKKIEEFFKRELNEHLKTFNPAHTRDFIDRYLVEIEKQRAKYPDTSFSQNMLINNAKDFFMAGSETVEGSLLWFVYIISAFPDVQRKVQKEIMEVIGPEKTPKYMDIRNMQYTHAVILETMRWKGIGPLGLMHYTLADTTVSGYNIQKGTTVIANLWAIHHDPRNWEEPEKFKPERFLSKDGKSVVKPSYFLPFSVGKRACPGDSMAYMELFLYSTSILREFDIAFPDEIEPSFKGQLGVTYQPEPYLVRFIPKN